MNMILALNLLTSSGSGVEWPRPLMIGWIIIALTLGVIEIFRLARQRLKNQKVQS